MSAPVVVLGYQNEGNTLIIRAGGRTVALIPRRMADLSLQLVSIAPLAYWSERFPARGKGHFDALAAYDKLRRQAVAAGHYLGKFTWSV